MPVAAKQPTLHAPAELNKSLCGMTSGRKIEFGYTIDAISCLRCKNRLDTAGGTFVESMSKAQWPPEVAPQITALVRELLPRVLLAEANTLTSLEAQSKTVMDRFLRLRQLQELLAKEVV